MYLHVYAFYAYLYMYTYPYDYVYTCKIIQLHASSSAKLERLHKVQASNVPT